jgi:hypothetical protein
MLAPLETNPLNVPHARPCSLSAENLQALQRATGSEIPLRTSLSSTVGVFPRHTVLAAAVLHRIDLREDRVTSATR